MNRPKARQDLTKLLSKLMNGAAYDDLEWLAMVLEGMRQDMAREADRQRKEINRNG